MTGAAPDPPLDADVRMRGFARRTTVEDALAWVDRQAKPLPDEPVPLSSAAGRVLAEAVVSPLDLPQFDRAMMDGFAVVAADTEGASPYNRLPLAVIGQSLPGVGFAGRVQPGQAVRIMTGAPLPAGADAVLPVEKVEMEGDGGSIAALDAVSPGKHVGRRGEDVGQGDQLLPAGRRLRPQDVGLLASVGAGQVRMVRQPRVRIIVTGDELLTAGSTPSGYCIVDSNGPMLAALVERDGGWPLTADPVPDRPEEILAAMRAQADVVLLAGGSSVGQEDHAPALLAEHGELAIHGVAMRPSSPTGMGRLDGRLLFLLPGNPVSCLCAYDFFAGRAIRALGGRDSGWPHRTVRRPLRRKISSVVGRVDYARVRLAGETVEPLAISGASILSSTTRADGFLIIPADSEGHPAGAEVKVYLYDG